MPDNFTVKIEKGKEGLYYATSPEIEGLLIGAPTVYKLLLELPRAIELLLLAKSK